jgi:hypothetical protein
MASLTPPARLLPFARLCLATTPTRSACSATAAARCAWSKPANGSLVIDAPAAAQQSSSYASVLKIKWNNKIKWNKLAPN